MGGHVSCVRTSGSPVKVFQVYSARDELVYLALVLRLFFLRTMQLQLTPFVRPNVTDHFWALEITLLSSTGEV